MERRKFRVLFSPAAQKDIEGMQVGAALQVTRDVLNYLEAYPLPLGKTRIRKLTGFNPPLYRLRNGDFRAYYRISKDDVVVLAITNRKDSEKLLKTLR